MGTQITQVGKERTLATAGFALALMVLVAIGARSSYDALAEADAAREVSATHETIAALQGIVTGIAVAESSLRGYAITLDERLLGELRPGIAQLRTSLRDAVRLSVQDPDARERLARMEPKVERRIALLEDGLARIQGRGGGAIEPEAPRLTDEIRRDVDELLRVARADLLRRHNMTTLHTERALVVRPAATLTAIVLLVVAFALLSREMTKRRLGQRFVQARLAEMTLLAELGELLQACRNVDEAYGMIGQLLPRLFPELTGAVSMFAPSRDMLEARATWGREAVLVGATLAPDDCWALRRGQAHACDGGAGGAGGGIRCAHSAGHEGAALCVPMAAHGELIGCLQLVHGRKIDADAKRLAGVVAEQVGLALANLQLKETLRLQSIRDPLTGLFNRRYTEETLSRELARAQRTNEALSVLFLDVDHFKRFNDSFGHDAGDHVLKQIAQVLQTSTRASDVAARMGGEELVVVLPAAGAEGALKRAEQIRATIEELSLRHRGQGLGKLTVSIGVATASAPYPRCDELLRAADAALYRAKGEGRNRVVVAG